MYVRDLEGNEFALQATTTVSVERNGNQELSCSILPNKVNRQFITAFSEMWEIVDHDDVTYKVIYAKPQGKGELPTVQVKAIPLFFDTFERLRIYDEYNEHMTAQEFFNLVFSGTVFDVVIVDSFSAIQWEGIGKGSTRLEMFKEGLSRYKAEFRIEGNTIYLETQIGRDTSFMYRHRLNASNITKEIDASALYTYARGYGDFEEGDEANAALIREYRSPLADIIGERHAPPIYDGRVTQASTMDEALKELVDNSLQVSVSADVHDLRKQGYPLAQPMLGDRVFLMDERIDLKEEVRVQDMTITKDWKGNVVDLNITMGSSSLSKRHQSSMRSVITNVEDILSGRKQLPYNALDAAVQRATKALQSAQTELEFGQGIIAKDPNDPNRLVIFNSAGLGISVDGGNSFEEAVTYLGINTNLLTAGQIKTNNIQIIGEDDLFYWDGNGLSAIDTVDPNKRVDLRAGLLSIKHGAIEIERPDGYVVMNNGLLDNEFMLQPTSPSFTNNNVQIDGYWFRTSVDYPTDCNAFFYKHQSRYLKIRVALYTDDANAGARLSVHQVGGGMPLLSQTVSYETDPENPSDKTMTIDLGVPDGSQKGVYIRLNSGVAGTNAYGRLLKAWLEL
ncbi:phage tail protein [Halobacillus karajensis]|uniref:phage tail protein n=1 Tax=Halobacillus karajensis TaxID=195088 RepID=UPI00045C637B|nr:phage tail protein [Halobacillus karajensis]CDQ17936.1 Prophage endopeptidase tail [Halobacillus karajensis]